VLGSSVCSFNVSGIIILTLIHWGLSMKHFIMIFVICIVFLMGFGFLLSEEQNTDSVNHYNSFLGPIKYNEYATDIQKNMINFLYSKGTVLVLIIIHLLVNRNNYSALIKLFITLVVWICRRIENLLPKYFQSRLFV
jgi:hypothetical protein